MDSDKQNQLDAIQNILGNSTSKNHTGRKNPKGVDRYEWRIKDEELAVNLYYSDATECDIKLAIKETDIKLSSMKMKIKNIQFLDTGEGLKNVSETTRSIFNRMRK